MLHERLTIVAAKPALMQVVAEAATLARPLPDPPP